MLARLGRFLRLEAHPGSLKEYADPRDPPRADACLDPTFDPTCGVSSNNRRLGHDQWRQDRRRNYCDGPCSKMDASPDEYVQNYFDILHKMSQREGAAQQRRWNAPKS